MGLSISITQSKDSTSTVKRDVASRDAKPAVSNISSSASTEDSVDILPGAGRQVASVDDDVAKPVMFCGLKISKPRKCSKGKCPFKLHGPPQAKHSFTSLDNKLIAASLRYFDASDAIYLQLLCKKMGQVLKTESWCEVLHLNNAWRADGVNTEKICETWFPYLKGVKHCIHREAPIIETAQDKPESNTNFRRTISHSQLNYSRPTSSPMNSGMIPVTPKTQTHAQRSPVSRRLPSFSPRNSNAQPIKYQREKWTDIHPAALTPFLKASKDSLISLVVFYSGNYTVDSVLKPVTEPLCLSQLKELRFTLMSDENSNNTAACDTEHIVLAIKPLDIPNCTTIQMCGSQNSNANAVDDNGPRLGRISSNGRMNPFIHDRMPAQSPKSHRSSNMDIVEAFGKIITRPDDLQSLNIELNPNEAEMVADLLPYVLEV